MTTYRILDTDPDAALDDLTTLAMQACSTPMALVSLLGEDRRWVKSRGGLQVDDALISAGFSAHVVGQRGLFVVTDALNDARFRDNQVVRGAPHVRFYAGAPLATGDGDVIGTLSVIDSQPRTLTADQKAALEALQRQVAAQLELRRSLAELRVALDGITKLGALVAYCSTCELNLVIPADPKVMRRVSDGVVAVLEGKQWPNERVMEVELALQEALANAVRHGCRNDPSKQVGCRVTFDENGDLAVVVRDPGPGFDVNAVAHPLEGANIFKASGRGVFLINELMDTVEFSDGGRQVLMRKRRDLAEEPPASG